MLMRKAIVAVLAAVLAGAAMLAMSPAQARPGEARSTSIPRTYDAAVAHFKNAPGKLRSDKRFVTPSGNIYCAMKVRYIPTGCEISQGTVKDPDACPAPDITQYVGRLEFHHGRAVAICNSDTIRTPGAPRLNYGDAARVPGSPYACLSEVIGVTCINHDEQEGFFLHKGEYVIFNAG